MIPVEVQEAIARLRDPHNTAGLLGQASLTDGLVLADYIASTQNSITVGRSDGSTESVSAPSHVSPGKHLAEAETLLARFNLDEGDVARATAHALVALTKQLVTDRIYVLTEVQR